MTTSSEFPLSPEGSNPLEQLMLLQPRLVGRAIGIEPDPPESGQLVWRKDYFRIFWFIHSSIINIGCRGHFREQVEDGCVLMVPAGIPVFFWREGNASYCNDLEFDGARYDVNTLPPRQCTVSWLQNAPPEALSVAGVAFDLSRRTSQLAQPIFTENSVLRVSGGEFNGACMLLDQLLQLHDDGGILASQLTKTFLMALVQAALDTEQLVLMTIPREAVENPHIMAVLKIVAERINDGSLDLEAIAAEVHLSPSYLSGLFSQHMNKPLMRYIQEKRVLAARRLLITNPHLSIKEIMAQVGINTPQQMSRTFKKILGCSPKEFRDTLE